MSMHLVSPPSALMNMLVSVLRKARFILSEFRGKRHARRANRSIANGACTPKGHSVPNGDTASRREFTQRMIGSRVSVYTSRFGRFYGAGLGGSDLRFQDLRFQTR